MQPSIITGDSNLPEGNAIARGGKAKPGEFDFIMAMLGSMLNTIPVEAAQQHVLMEDKFLGNAPGKIQLPNDLNLFSGVYSNDTVETIKPGLAAVSSANQVFTQNQPQDEAQSRQLKETMPTGETVLPSIGTRPDISTLSGKKDVNTNVSQQGEEHSKAATKQLQMSEPVLASPTRDVHRFGLLGQTVAARGLHQQQIQQPVAPDSVSRPQELDMDKDIMKHTSARQNQNVPNLNNTHLANTQAASSGTVLVSGDPQELDMAKDIMKDTSARQNQNVPNLNNTHLANTQAASNGTVLVSVDVSKGVTLGGLNDRIVQEFKHILINFKGEQQSHVHLKLEPEHLGTVTIKLFISRGDINAHFYTGNVFVKEALENSMQQLREMLGMQELRLNEALVFSGNGDRDQAGSHFEGHQEKGPHTGRYGYGAGSEVETERLPSLAGSGRVNYLV